MPFLFLTAPCIPTFQHPFLPIQSKKAGGSLLKAKDLPVSALWVNLSLFLFVLLSLVYEKEMEYIYSC